MAAHFEPDVNEPFDAAALVTRCIESGADSLLLDEAALPPEFFDLSTGVAGELLHSLAKYRLRLAAVVRDPAQHSAPFQDFAREATRGTQFRFFASRNDALAWLAALPGAQGAL